MRRWIKVCGGPVVLAVVGFFLFKFQAKGITDLRHSKDAQKSAKRLFF
jgi:hypothetical protein